MSRMVQRATFCALAISTLSACSFRVPSVAEQEKLMEMGAFPTGVPGWISPAAKGESPGAAMSSGLVPLSFSAQPSQPSAAAFSTGSVTSKAFEEAPQPSLPPRASTAQAAASLTPSSPLERIAATCPNIESAVSSALTTTEADIRIKKYEALTKRCPTTPDLWIWLGKDYLKTGNYAKATQSAESVLRIENQHQEARALLSEIRKAQLERQATIAPTPKN